MVQRFASCTLPGADVAIRSSETPDFAALAAAEFFIGSGFDPERLKRHAERLRVAHCLTAGVDYYLPLDWLRPGAVLTNSSAAHEEKGGQYGLMAVLMLNERVPRHLTSQRRRAWRQTFSSSIRGKTALFFGTGALGGAVAACLRLIGVRCIGFSRSGAPSAHFDACFKAAPLHEWLPSADFFIVAAPLTGETRGAIGVREIALLPARAGIVNIGRAPIIDHDALCAALREDRLSGAVLDVFDPEPLPADSHLWETPNLVITPHTSCDDHDSYVDRCLAVFADNVDRLLPTHHRRDLSTSSTCGRRVCPAPRSKLLKTTRPPSCRREVSRLAERVIDRAMFPEFHRFMRQETLTNNPRLKWVAEAVLARCWSACCRKSQRPRNRVSCPSA